MSSTAWKRLIRFVALEDGQAYFGEPQTLNAVNGTTISSDSAKARILKGDLLGQQELSAETKTVAKLLAPIGREQVPLVRCVGLNYAKHVAEGGRFPVPDWPTLFIKPRTSVADPGQPICIPPCAQSTVDYEGEMVIIIGKSGKDIPKERALDHVLGFTIGNDITWREAQLKPNLSGTQWCLGKGLDDFAPIGPVLVSPKEFDHNDKAITLRLNGQVMQAARTSHMVHKVEDIVARFSVGTTLEAGTVIMTGTPDGIGYAKKPNPVFLRDGDEIEIEIEGLGILRHSITFQGMRA